MGAATTLGQASFDDQPRAAQLADPHDMFPSVVDADRSENESDGSARGKER
jgi:hypothetical protein